ncbi:MAG TPA: 50S ribosomal protein L21 [Thermotogota bacterium]|jgi:large subunit ribosomal protein L21|nr:50S ribosomal protein L21 [Thermotogota bacterium]NLZ13939.1 50S ribosomal protein L21 [Thermotogaceae bacterium]MDD8040286.1 50S ribosomal protein L21 [Thermotogota bacterium]MDD8053523.1 50S ribosomal protein L21 [Thermotogota bacterium]HNR62536.1 50S ribosomal protein L21 [Thermotogota bacterium]
MYAIIHASGKQYRVEEGQVLYTEKQPLEKDDRIVFDQVLMVKDEGVTIGKPFIEGAKVIGIVQEHVREPKVLIIRFKGRKQYRRTRGHKQWKTAILIDKIEKA